MRLQTALLTDRGGDAACVGAKFTTFDYLAAGLLQTLIHHLLHEVFVRLRLHELERVILRLVLVQLLVAHLLIVKLLGVQFHDTLDICNFKVNLIT